MCARPKKEPIVDSYGWDADFEKCLQTLINLIKLRDYLQNHAKTKWRIKRNRDRVNAAIDKYREHLSSGQSAAVSTEVTEYFTNNYKKARKTWNDDQDSWQGLVWEIYMHKVRITPRGPYALRNSLRDAISDVKKRLKSKKHQIISSASQFDEDQGIDDAIDQIETDSNDPDDVT